MVGRLASPLACQILGLSKVFFFIAAHLVPSTCAVRPLAAERPQLPQERPLTARLGGGGQLLWDAQNGSQAWKQQLATHSTDAWLLPHLPLSPPSFTQDFQVAPSSEKLRHLKPEPFDEEPIPVSASNLIEAGSSSSQFGQLKRPKERVGPVTDAAPAAAIQTGSSLYRSKQTSNANSTVPVPAVGPLVGTYVAAAADDCSKDCFCKWTGFCFWARQCEALKIFLVTCGLGCLIFLPTCVIRKRDIEKANVFPPVSLPAPVINEKAKATASAVVDALKHEDAHHFERGKTRQALDRTPLALAAHRAVWQHETQAAGDEEESAAQESTQDQPQEATTAATHAQRTRNKEALARNQQAVRQAQVDSAVENAKPKLLKLIIVGARDLRNADIGSKSDPYCVCKSATTNQILTQTRVCNDMLNPRWDHQVEITEDVVGDELLFEVLDKDWPKKDDFLGSTTLHRTQFMFDGFDGELELTKGGKGVKPYLTIKIVVEEGIDAAATELDSGGVSTD